jgi:hypothetical protein
MLIALYSNGRRAGKDTAAEYIHEWCEEHGYGYQRLAFADKLKLLIAETLGMVEATDAETIERVDEFKLYGGIEVTLSNQKSRDSDYYISGRDIIINMGGEIKQEQSPTGARKLFGETFWTDQILPLDSAFWKDPRTITVITDLRGDTEAKRVVKLGGLVYEVKRAYTETGRSEGELWPGWITGYLENNSSLDKYRTKVRSLLDRLTCQ